MYKVPKIKICGMKNPENIKSVQLLMPDFMGFIFHEKSPRFVDENTLIEIIDVLDEQSDTKRIGVFVNEELTVIEDIVKRLNLDLVQLHGEEQPIFCSEVQLLGVQVIKAFAVDSNFDYAQLDDFREVCDYYLFDTKGKFPGGNGFAFDWTILAGYTGEMPFFLGGGIDFNSIKKIKGFKHPQLFAIDLNSRFEFSTGLKDVEILEKFITKVRDTNNQKESYETK